jgi:hypothetical protein
LSIRNRLATARATNFDIVIAQLVLELLPSPDS